MRIRYFQKARLALVALTVLALTAGNALAQNSTTSASTIAAQSDATGSAPQLSYGVVDVLKLSQAKVDDGTIINYIRNSGNDYGLSAAQIIYLRQQGVSSAVINAMVDQRSQVPQTASAAAPTQTTGTSTYTAPVTTVAAQPTVTYVQTVPSSSVYIIPDTQTYRYNNWYYYHNPYYCYYPTYSYCWPYSAVSVSFIGHRNWVGYHGGWHGGGGWHR